MNDFENQVRFVSGAVPRITSQIDLDPLSSSYGCAHLAYWRDKTSDVADIRRQEAMLPLSLFYHRSYPGSTWPGSETLRQATAALLEFWCRRQYPDGSFDEWYRGERAFAAAAFSSHAAARTMETMRGRLPAALEEQARQTLDRTATWLCRRNDLFKTNHQAVGAAALAFCGRLLNEPRFTTEARHKLDSIRTVQTSEGWFPEIGHMDVGYTFLTVEFAAMTMELLDDWSWLDCFRRAFDFACQWVHPDLTIGEEYGVCHNPYLSRIAVVLMSPFSGKAAYLRRRLESESPGFKGLLPTLADDLRLPRWAFQPLLAYDYGRRFPGPPELEEDLLPLADPGSGDRDYPQAGLTRMVIAGRPAILAPAAGGLVRIFGPNEHVWSDWGYAVRGARGYAASLAYRPGMKKIGQGDEIRMECPIAPVKKFMPPFWARAALRLACSTALSSRLTRKMIDIFRKKRGTALNQSSANLMSSSPWRLQRTLRRQNDGLTIIDVLSFDRPVLTQNIFAMSGETFDAPKLIPVLDLAAEHRLPSRVRRLRLERTMSLKDLPPTAIIKAAAE
ncbi:MAG: hypothetical protein AB1641_14465 [Thermodesulfobacteriota bacterium]